MTEPEKFRHECNQKILTELSDLVEKHPDWRFHQILMNYDIEIPGEDKFYEESNETLKKLMEGQNDND